MNHAIRLVMLFVLVLSSLEGCGIKPSSTQQFGAGLVELRPQDILAQDPRYGDYLDHIRRRIKEKWVYPCVKDLASGRCEYKSAKVVVAFEILPNGHIPRPIHETSGYEIYDGYAANAVMLGSPFAPPPAELMALADSTDLKGPAMRVLAVFNYLGTKPGDGR